ncbi:uncharacterized protein J3R85_010240 [Psidium guajava]|nr:uncharacterized protein J3R85_010240 [Psidium guajava]
MASSSLHMLFLTSLIVASTSTSAASAGGGSDGLAWVTAAAASSGPGKCRGSLAECMAVQDGEFAMDTEVNRRVLATTQYISYGALQRNTVPCSQRGASYYNCQQGAQANPYSRSCSAVTQCRS